MLKIESDAQYSLNWQKKEEVFSKTFLIAFLIALFIHISGWVLIEIKDYPPKSTYLFPFVSVSAPLLKMEETAPLDEWRELMPPPQREPQMPPLQHKAPPAPLLSAFTPQEISSSPYRLPFKTHSLLTYSPSVSIDVVGEWAENVSILNQALMISALLDLKAKEGNFRFDFLFDPINGELIAPIHPINQEIASLLLEKLRLKSISSAFPHSISLEVQISQRGSL